MYNIVEYIQKIVWIFMDSPFLEKIGLTGEHFFRPNMFDVQVALSIHLRCWVKFMMSKRSKIKCFFANNNTERNCSIYFFIQSDHSSLFIGNHKKMQGKDCFITEFKLNLFQNKNYITSLFKRRPKFWEYHYMHGFRYFHLK